MAGSYTRFTGKAGLVTGAGMGIGAAVARALAGEGAAVAVVDRDAAAAEQVSTQIGQDGGRAIAVAASVRPAEPLRVVEATAEELAAHAELAALLHRTSGGDCLWMKLEQQPHLIAPNTKMPQTLGKEAAKRMGHLCGVQLECESLFEFSHVDAEGAQFNLSDRDRVSRAGGLQQRLHFAAGIGHAQVHRLGLGGEVDRHNHGGSSG